MELTLLLVILFAVFALLRGGSLDALATTKFRWTWALLLSLAVQLGVDIWSPEWLTKGMSFAIVLATNALVVIFLLINLRLPGTSLAAIGLLLNIAVIGANGAMPVSPRAAEMAGRTLTDDDFGLKHELLTDETRLPWLGDVIPLPKLKFLFSLGDIVLALGIARLVYERATSNLGGRHQFDDASIPARAASGAGDDEKGR